MMEEHVHEYRALWSGKGPVLVCDCQYSLNEQMIIEQCNAAGRLSAAYAALLRVAKAAENAWPFMFEDIPKALNSKRVRYEKLYEALKEAEPYL